MNDKDNQEEERDDLGRFDLNNQIWNKRAKHGRDKIFGDPVTMWEACLEYFNFTIGRSDWDGLGIKRKTRVPFTMTGLSIFLGVHSRYFYEFFRNLDKEGEYFSDFSIVIKRVEEIIQTQQVEGAITGIFKENLVARLNGIKDTVREELITEEITEVKFFDSNEDQDDDE